MLNDEMRERFFGADFLWHRSKTLLTLCVHVTIHKLLVRLDVPNSLCLVYGTMTNPLKEWRAERSQHEAGKLLGVDAMTYSRWERGVHLPRKSNWPVIKKVTGIPPERLLEIVGDVQ
jgi:DNA-binding XRE family transcriptional regulator